MRRPAGSSLQQTGGVMERWGNDGVARVAERRTEKPVAGTREETGVRILPGFPGLSQVGLNYRSGGWSAGSGSGTSTSVFRYFTFEIYQPSTRNLGGS